MRDLKHSKYSVKNTETAENDSVYTSISSVRLLTLIGEFQPDDGLCKKSNLFLFLYKKMDEKTYYR